MKEIIEIQEEVRIPQDDHDLILEKGDQIRLLKKTEKIFPSTANIEKAIGAYRRAFQVRSSEVIDSALEELHIEVAEDIWNLNPEDFNALWIILDRNGFI